MRISEIIQQRGLVLVRPRQKGIPGDPPEYDVKDYGEKGNKKGWVYLDETTKSAMRTVYNVLSEKSQKRYNFVPLIDLVNFTWKHVTLGGGK